LNQINHIFFDLDDTLFDASGLAEKARKAAIESMIEKGLSGINSEKGYKILREIVEEYGSNYGRHFDMFLKRLNAYSSKLVSVAIISYHRVKVQDIRLYPDVFKFLQNLKNMTSVQLGIITNGLPVKQYEKIIRLGLDAFFELIIISDELGIRKPNPELFRKALKLAGAKAENALYIGDNIINDVLPAKKVGMVTCFIHRKGKHDKPIPEKYKDKVDFEIENFDVLWEKLKFHLKSK